MPKDTHTEVKDHKNPSTTVDQMNNTPIELGLSINKFTIPPETVE